MFVLRVEVRTTFGRAWSRRQRREGKIPAVVYGRTTPPVHILLDRRTLARISEGQHSGELLLIAGQMRLRVRLGEVQRHPLGEVIEHVDFIGGPPGEIVEEGGEEGWVGD